MWINLRLTFDNADVNSSTTLKVTSSSSSSSPTSNLKMTSLVAATGLDTANQK
jgi:hypothetical protein